MEHNKLDQVPLADIDDKVLNEIKGLESKLHDKFYLIAFNK